MRTLVVVCLCALVLVLGVQTGSATPPITLVSPALEFNANQRLECQVVNADDSTHTVAITFYNSTGAVVSGNPPQVVPPHGSAGISFPSGFGANHCEIVAEGHADDYRASIDVIDITATVQPQVVVAMPFQ